MRRQYRTTVAELEEMWGHGPEEWGLPPETPTDLTVIFRPDFGAFESWEPPIYLAQTADEDVPGGGYTLSDRFTEFDIPPAAEVML